MASKVFRVTKGFAKNLSNPSSLGAVTHQRNINTESLPIPEVTVLPNGLTVATETYTKRPSATVGLYVAVGSRYENRRNNGVANLTNTLLLQGENMKKADGIGAVVSGETTREITSYTVNCLGKDAATATALLGGMVQEPNVSDATIQAARTRILNDLENAGDDAICMDFVHSTAYKDTPLGMSVQGSTANIKLLDKDAMKAFMGTHYTPERMVLVGAGGVKHADLVKAAEAHFKMPGGPVGVDSMLPKNYTAGMTHYRDDAKPFAFCAWVSEIPGYDSPHHFHFRVAQMAAGFYDKSNLAGINRKSVLGKDCANLNLAQAVGPVHLLYADTGLIGNWYITTNDHVETVAEVATFAMVDKMVETKDLDAERGQHLLLQELANNMQCNQALTRIMANDLIHLKRVVPHSERIDRIKECSGADVTLACRDQLYDRDPTFIGVGPVEGLHDYNYMRGKMYTARF